VSSGDLELLLEPGNAGETIVVVQTKVSGYRQIWEALLKRFFERHPIEVNVEIRDGGATPGTVWLRLEQGMELALEERADE
jgi:malonate decarboxylase delta subunit